MSVWRKHMLVLAGVIAGLLAIFHVDALAMVHQWTASDTYQHCLFILPIIAWLIWQRRAELPANTPAPFAPALALVFASALVWLVGEAAGVALIRHFALVCMIQFSILAVMGTAVSAALAFPIFYLDFLVPFGDELLPVLQTITARIAMLLLGLTGIPAKLEGVYITTPDGWFHVAEACSGVMFLVAMLALGALVAHVGFRSVKRRTIFMIACVIVPILANGIRAWGTMYAAHLWGVKAATGFDHIVYGWFFFAFVMTLIIGGAWNFFDRDVGDKWLTGPIPPAVAKGALIPVAVGALALAAIPPVWSAAIAGVSRATLPQQVSLPQVPGWTLVPVTGPAWQPRFDNADHRLYARYRDATGASVDVAIGLFAWQGEGRKLIGYGQGAADADHGWHWTQDDAPPEGGKAQRLLGLGAVAREAMTFYVVGGGSTGDTGSVKWRTMTARLFGGDQRASAIIVSAIDTPQSPARPVLDRFMTAFGPPAAQTDRLFTQAGGR